MNEKKFGFEVSATDGVARRGHLSTAHGNINTPAFMPVGTQGTVKGMTSEAVAATGAEILLGNTYHLMLRPGAEAVAELGGLHRFMSWDKPILTDSGGFQVMSLANLRVLNEDGVVFQSHLDGASYELSPERSVHIQKLLDADITMVLDECTSFPVKKSDAAKSMRLSMRWAKRCRDAFVDRCGYGLFGIVQGSVFADLRCESAAALNQIGFEGYAVGGLAIGEGQDVMFEVVDTVIPMLPTHKPRYLMGVGTPSDIVGAVQRGVDMFDCVLPTRSGRTGQGFTRRGTINIRNARHAGDPRPIDSHCDCPTCVGYTRAYLHHLFKAREMLGPMLLTTHNMNYYQSLTAGLRSAVEKGELERYAADLKVEWQAGDIEAI